MITAMLHGIVLAFGLIIPLGAQNVFVFNQGASQPHFKKAIPVIITASLCDTVLILLAILGVSVIVFAIPALQIALYSIGLIFLIYMGWAIWKSKPSKLEANAVPLSWKKQILFAMSVSLLNPHAIMDTIGVIGTSSLSYTGIDKITFASATIIISWIWFFSIALAGKIVGQLDTDGKMMLVINKVSAIIIWTVAVYITFKLYQM